MDYEYPDYYGGAYINKEKQFVILIKGDTSRYKDEFVRRVKSSEVLVKTCEYSYEELRNVIERLKVLYLDESNKATIEATTMRRFCFDVPKNRIIVELEELTEKKKNLFKQTVMDSPTFIFEKNYGIPMLETDLKLGDPLWNGPSTTIGMGSIGYRAKQYGIPGVVVSSHLVPFFGNPLYYKGTQVGSCISSIMAGSIDAAFCELYSGNNLAMKTAYGGKSLSTTLGNLWSGGDVYMEGASTRSVSHGSILQIDDNGDFEYIIGQNGSKQIIHLVNVVKSNYKSQPGDSGGIVYDGYNQPLGIHEGAAKYGGTYFIKASEINRQLSLTMY